MIKGFLETFEILLILLILAIAEEDEFLVN